MKFSTEWSSFTRRIFIYKDVETVYNAWALSGELEKWFFEKADYLDTEGNAIAKNEYVKSNFSCAWKWFGWPHIHTGKILDAIMHESLKFEFSPGGNVLLEFKSVSDNCTELILQQKEIPHSDENDIKNFYYGCSLGWSFWMINLKAFLEHGIVLNDKTNPYADDPKKLELVNH